MNYHAMKNMKIKTIILILFLNFIAFVQVSLANKYSSIDYEISFSNENKTPIAKIYTTIKGTLSKEVVIDLPYGWASISYIDQIKNIKLLNTNYKFTINKNNQHQLIATLPEEINSLKFSYEIHQKSGDPSDVHETIIRKDLIHSTGYGMFAIPTDIADEKKIQFTLKWNNIPPTWQTNSSYGTDKLLKFSATSLELTHAIYAAGEMRIYQIADKNSPVFLSLYGKFDLEDHLIKSSLQKIIKTQRNFFNDHDFPIYAMSIIEGDEPGSMGGTRLHNSFTASLPHDMEPRDYYILFAHEHLHNWIGGKISNQDEDARLNYWWSEGFTDYYARVLSMRFGIITFDEFIEECNQLLREYYLSPAINEPNARIEKDFWHDYDIEKLPYL